ETVVLARGGQAAATIVLPDHAAGRLKEGAVELQTDIRRICGVELSIARDGKVVTGTGLYLGRCGPAKESDLPDEKLNPESYAIRVRDGNIFFEGRYPTPTYFGVISFIENTLGVRWFAPGDDWEYVPRGKQGELVVDVREAVKVPDTSPRLWSRHD